MRHPRLFGWHKFVPVALERLLNPQQGTEEDVDLTGLNPLQGPDIQVYRL